MGELIGKSNIDSTATTQSEEQQDKEQTDWEDKAIWWHKVAQGGTRKVRHLGKQATAGGRFALMGDKLQGEASKQGRAGSKELIQHRRGKEGKVPPHILQDQNTSHIHVILVVTAFSQSIKPKISLPLPLEGHCAFSMPFIRKVLAPLFRSNQQRQRLH